MITITPTANDVGQRIDNFIKKTYPKLKLFQIQKYIRIKRLKVNEKKVNNDYRLQANDKIQLYINDNLLEKERSVKDYLLAPTTLDVVFEDKNILIINKPVGLVVHDDETKTTDTLSNRVMHYLFNKKEWDPATENSFVPALVHRLDKNTSGLVMAAKNAVSLRILSQKIKNHEIDKYYLCRVHGYITPASASMTAYWTREHDNKFVKITKKPINSTSQLIVTEYKTIKQEHDTSLLEVKLVTGKTHQIRAHFNFINYPLVGEQKYTKKEFSKINNQYQALISYKIYFNFKNNAGILQYLDKKTFILKNCNC